MSSQRQVSGRRPAPAAVDRTASRREVLATLGTGMAGAVLSSSAAGAAESSAPSPAASETPRSAAQPAGSYDVVVAGGGIAGVAAATAAARAGARVGLVEMQPFAGGVTTAGMEPSMCNFFHNTRGELLVGGRPLELVERLVKLGAAHKNWDQHRGHIVFDVELGKLVMDRMLEDAGVNILYNTTVIGAVLEGNRLAGLRIANRSGNQVVTAKCTVDATGDADVAHWAGAPLHVGRGQMPHSFLFRLGNVDLDALYEYFKQNPAEYVAESDINLTHDEGMRFYEDTGILYIHHHGKKLRKILDAALQRNEYADSFGPFQHTTAFQMHGIRWNRTLVVNTGYFRLAEPGGRALSDYVRHGRKLAHHVAAFLRKSLPGCKDSFVAATANAPGIRRTRWLKTDFTMTRQIYDSAPRFDDAVGRGVVVTAGKLYRTDRMFDVPLRCLLPQKIDGLLIGSGRSASADQAEMLRVQPATMIVGQGAGVTAAVCARDGVEPRSVDVRAVREALAQQGVDLS